MNLRKGKLDAEGNDLEGWRERERGKERAMERPRLKYAWRSGSALATPRVSLLELLTRTLSTLRPEIRGLGPASVLNRQSHLVVSCLPH